MPKKKLLIDTVDAKIINLILANPKITFNELVESSGITKTPLFIRLKKLEEQGVVLKGMTVTPTYFFVKEECRIFLRLTTSVDFKEQVDGWLKTHDWVESVIEEVSQDDTYTLWIRAVGASEDAMTKHLQTLNSFIPVEYSIHQAKFREDLKGEMNLDFGSSISAIQLD